MYSVSVLDSLIVVIRVICILANRRTECAFKLKSKIRGQMYTTGKQLGDSYLSNVIVVLIGSHNVFVHMISVVYSPIHTLSTNPKRLYMAACKRAY